MLAQRQKALAKQKGVGIAAGPMVSSGLNLTENSGAFGAGPASPTAKSPSLSGTPQGRIAGIPSVATPQASASSPAKLLEDREDSPQSSEKGNGSKEPAPPPITKEEEERRRASLQQELNDRGICPVFDPVDAGGIQASFDVATVQPQDMKAFLHDPAPKNAGIMQCRITRDRSGISNKLHPKYSMFSDSGVFLMTAQKQTKNKTSNYAITMSKTKDAAAFLGKLRSDFLGIEWVAYGPGLNPSKVDSKLPPGHALQLVRQELCAIQYTSSKWGAGAKGPRKMSVILPHVQPSGERLVCQTMTPQKEGLVAMREGAGRQRVDPTRVDCYLNKPPKWNDQIGAYVLNFNKRVTEASVKNFQLINSEDPETVYLQFGRVGKEEFNLDFRWPLSPFQAFAMCLSSFDYKLGCE
jgi:tubby-related protein 1